MKDASEDTIHGQIDTSFTTTQRDLYTSGLVASIGVNAFAVWGAIKHHADYNSGVSWPSIKRLCELTGLANLTVQRSLKTLVESKLLRIEKRGRSNLYTARERMNLSVGDVPVCTVVVDYAPARLRKTLPRIKGLVEGTDHGDDVQELLAQIEIIPGPGFVWDPESGSLKHEVPARLLASSAPKPVPSDTPLSRRLEQVQAMAKAKRAP
ncbi:MAG: helix-turn-helix domain-containing protein [Azonexus sp.]